MRRHICVFALLAAAAAAPATYDQRQEGEFNFSADVENLVLLVAYPQKLAFPLDALEGLVKFKQNGREAQDRADVQVMEAFVEPDAPYRVTIGPEGADRAAEGDGRAVEVVIAGRRAGEPQDRAEEPKDHAEEPQDRNELKLLGAIEQCGPEAERDPISLKCRLRAAPPELEHAPEVVPVST